MPKARALTCLPLALIVLCLPGSTYAQTSDTEREHKQFWPELDVYWRLKPNVRLFFNAAITKETGKSNEADLGASIDFFVKRLVKLERVTGLHIDESKASPLMLRAGYHFIASKDGSREHRLVFEGTPRLPLKAGAVVSIRNRVDLRFQDNFSWRYRNRVMLEREFEVGSYHIAPYMRAEFYYDSSAAKWSRTAITVGCTFPIRKRSELEVYFEHQNDTGNRPNRQVNALGVALSLYFKR